MFYIVYQITNKINGKFYIGCHKTKTLDDGYMGSGNIIKSAIKKYGSENFDKQILFQFESPEEMFEQEKQSIAELTPQYNLHPGGNGGFDYINNNNLKTVVHSAEHMKELRRLSAKKVKELRKNKDWVDYWRSRVVTESRKYFETHAGNFKGKNHSEETKLKMSQSSKGTGVSKHNSQYGSMWVTDGNETKKIKKDAIIPPGWCKGRTMRV